MEEEDAKNELSYILCDESQENVHHLFEDEIIGNFLFSNHLLAQNTNIESDLDGDFETNNIEGFLESINKESVPFELTNIPTQQTHKSFDHFVQDELLEDLVISNFLVSHIVKDESDQVKGVEVVVIDEILELCDDEGSFFNESGDT